MKTRKVRIDGINEIKYPAINNRESFDDVIHFHINEIIKRDKASITNRIGA